MTGLRVVHPGYPDDEPHASHAPLAGLSLVESMGRVTWLGRTGDGAFVAARRLVGASDKGVVGPDEEVVDAAGLIARAATLARVRGPLVPVLGAVLRTDAVWLVSQLDGGVPLRRLVQVAGLSPRQAVAVAAGVLRGLEQLHAAGYVHGRVHSGNVHVGPGGEVRLGDWAPANLIGAGAADQVRRGDLAGAAAVSAELVRAGRSPASGTRLLAAVRDAVSGAIDTADPGSMAAALEAASGGPDGLAAGRGELAVLVAAVPRSVGPWQHTPRLPAPGTPPAGMTGPRQAVRRLGPALRATGRRLWVLGATLGALAVAVGLEFAFLHGQLTYDLHRLLGDTQTARHAGSSAPAARSPDPVPFLAPPAAGQVTGVDVRALRPCGAGTACPVRVLVGLRPQRRPVPVRWSFEVVDRCTDKRALQPASPVWARAGSDHVYGLGELKLPPGRSLAVTAVTSRPARAAAPPLTVPADGGTC